MNYHFFRYEKPIAKIYEEDCTFVPKDANFSQLEYAYLEEVCNHWNGACTRDHLKLLQQKTIEALHRRNGPYTLITEEAYEKGWWEALREARDQITLGVHTRPSSKI